jgi:hypothetical protein
MIFVCASGQMALQWQRRRGLISYDDECSRGCITLQSSFLTVATTLGPGR